MQPIGQLILKPGNQILVVDLTVAAYRVVTVREDKSLQEENGRIHSVQHNPYKEGMVLEPVKDKKLCLHRDIKDGICKNCGEKV